MATTENTQPLVSLGFTALEAEIYTFLLRESPVTGYRIAQALRKPAPNIYKAIESLEAKGAVMVDDGASRLCHPVSPDELLGHLERRFQTERARAARSLSEISAPPGDDRVYQLRSPDQVMERGRNMLKRCREVALVDGFPLPLETLRPDLEAAAGRGAEIAVKAYAPIELPGARVVLDPRGESVFERWRGQWINLVIDGSEHLVAFLTDDGRGVYQAIWSGSVYLSWVYHSALSSEIALNALEGMMEDGATLDSLRAARDELTSLKAFEATGYQTLARRFEDAQPAAGSSRSRRRRK